LVTFFGWRRNWNNDFNLGDILNDRGLDSNDSLVPKDGIARHFVHRGKHGVEVELKTETLEKDNHRKPEMWAIGKE
jgi:hypothetical protein